MEGQDGGGEERDGREGYADGDGGDWEDTEGSLQDKAPVADMQRLFQVLFQLNAAGAAADTDQRIYQAVKIQQMTSIKSQHQILEEKQRRKVLRHADVHQIMNHSAPQGLQVPTSTSFPIRDDRGNVALMLKSELNSEARQMKKAMQDGGNCNSTEASEMQDDADVRGGHGDAVNAVATDARNRAEDQSLKEFSSDFTLDLQLPSPRTAMVMNRLWGETPPNDREFDAIEASFRLELMLSVGAICFDADNDARNSEKAHECCTGIFPPHVNTFRARSQRRVNLAKKLSLFKLKEDALEQVYYKRERARKQAARKRSEALATLAAAFSGPHYSLAPGQDVTAFRLALTALGVVKGSGDPLSDLSIVRVFEQLMATGHDITLKRVLQALDVELSPVTAKQLNEEIRRKKLGMYDIYHDICKNNENSNHNDNHK